MSLLSTIKTSRLTQADKTNYYYIIVNICLSAFSFVRSFVFMRYLDLKELGIISLVQTIFMFIGLLQMGLLNGGFRIVSLGKSEEMEKTNNSIYSYLSLLLPLGVIFCVLSSYFDWIDELSLTLLLISVVFGVFTLINNWYHNVLIGEQKLSEVNFLNIFSFGIAAIALPLTFLYGFWGGMIVIMIQPLVFVSLGAYRNKELIPTGFYFNYDYIKYILSFGFIPFLCGIFLSIYLQIERWSITKVLGIEALGEFYLVFLYVSLFQLIPNSINSIFFPRGVKAYSKKEFIEFNNLLKYYYVALATYGIAISFITFLLLEPVVSLVFPKHIPGVILVFIILPGLVLQSLSEPIGLILNSSVILKPMLLLNVINLLLCSFGIFVMISYKCFSLSNVAILRAISGGGILVGYIIIYFLIKKKLFK